MSIPKLSNKVLRIIQLCKKVKINLFQFSLGNFAQLIQNTISKEARQFQKQTWPSFQTIYIKIDRAIPLINGSVKIVNIHCYNLKIYNKVTIKAA